MAGAFRPARIKAVFADEGQSIHVSRIEIILADGNLGPPLGAQHY
jgi:hypothetical protein